jgi:SAM-dependent methyltransferase
MVDAVSRQYEAYPYPARDPAKETEELLIGSPSHPLEIDHFIFDGQRDWTEPTRILVAGGGTGDALVMMAQVFADWGANVDIHYLDMSVASRKIAEARMAARGLSATYHTGDLLSAPEIGPFDYIDCCGVLHHLPDPVAGASALRAALAPRGGMGVMVYAPYGRSGVYEMQDVLRALVGGDEPAAQVEKARRLIGSLPPTNGLARNPFVGDHLNEGDAGLYDLLLHGRDRAYDVDGVYGLLDAADLSLISFAMPGRYNPRALIGDAELRERAAKLPPREGAALAERLSGNIKAHVFYAVPKGTEADRVAQISPEAVPNFVGPKGAELAKSIWEKGGFAFNLDGLVVQRNLPKDVAGLVGGIDGKRSLLEIGKMMGWDGKVFQAGFKNLYQPLNNFNLLRFSARKGL